MLQAFIHGGKLQSEPCLLGERSFRIIFETRYGGRKRSLKRGSFNQQRHSFGQFLARIAGLGAFSEEGEW